MAKASRSPAHPASCAPQFYFRTLKTSKRWTEEHGKPKLELFLVRHGRAAGNHYHLFNGGKYDAPLTNLGRCQVKMLAKKWPKRFKPDIIICSTLLRARSTARPLAKKFNMRIHPEPLIVEQDFGGWVGKSARLLKVKYPELFFTRTDGRKSHFIKSCPGGESWNSVITRARRFLTRLKREQQSVNHHDARRIVVISHGVFLIACLHLLVGIRPPHLWDLHFNNTSVVRIRI